MPEQNRPAFEKLECISCRSETRHYAVVDTDSSELMGGLCTNCAPEDEWSEINGTCMLCENSGSYSLEAISPHPEQEDRSTYSPSQDGPLLCETHFIELSG